MTALLRSFGLVALFAIGSPNLALAQEGETPLEAANPGEQDAVPEAAAPEDAAPALPMPGSLEEAATVDLEAFKDLSEQPDESLTQGLSVWGSRTTEAIAAYESATGGDKDTAKSALDRVQGVFEQLVATLDTRGVDLPPVVAEVNTELGALAESEAEIQTGPLTPAGALEVDLKVLKAQLRPMTLEQVEPLLVQWRDVVQRKAEIVRNLEIAEIRSRDGADAENEQQNEDLVLRAAELKKLSERMMAVVDAYEAKGGESKGYRDYLESLEKPVEFTGLMSAWVQARTWLISEDGGIALALNLVTFLAILFIFRILARVVSKIADRAFRTMKNSPALLRNFIVNTVRKLISFIGLIVALGELGVDIGPFVAAIGAVGFVIGFALQGTLSNFAAGVMVMLYRPFDLGDVVSAAGVTGKVDGMTLVSTTVKTFDNQTIVVPNSMVWGDVITNITANSTRRVDLTFGIGYGDDIEKALQVLGSIVEAHPMVLKDPAPTIKLHALADSSVNFVVRPWSKTADYWDVYWDITRKVKERFDAEGISIPFPQRDVHLHQVPANTSA